MSQTSDPNDTIGFIIITLLGVILIVALHLI
jgi:hypothetical protein